MHRRKEHRSALLRKAPRCRRTEVAKVKHRVAPDHALQLTQVEPSRPDPLAVIQLVTAESQTLMPICLDCDQRSPLSLVQTRPLASISIVGFPNRATGPPNLMAY